MNITEIAPKKQGLNSLSKLSELVEKQGFYIGQTAFFKSWNYREEVVISGYVFEVKGNKLELSYHVENAESINRFLAGEIDEPSSFGCNADQLCRDRDLAKKS